MTIGRSLREIADVLDQFEDAGFEIVQPRSRDDEERVAVEFGAIVPALEGIDAGEAVDVTVRGASVDEHDRVVLDISVGAAVDGADEAGTGDGAGEVGPVDEGATGTDTGDAASSRSEGDDGATTRDAAGRDESAAADSRDEANRQPAHRDPEKLRAVYDAHDTFADMTDALGVDVTPQTVRRQMIEHGIHHPGPGGDARASHDDASETDDDPGEPADEGPVDDRGDGRGEAEDAPEDGPEQREQNEDAERSGPVTTLADGIDLPDGTGLDELKEAVLSSRTVHEVGRALGTDRERTRRLLSELDLLELVTGRLSAAREVTPEEIDRRVERATPRNA